MEQTATSASSGLESDSTSLFLGNGNNKLLAVEKQAAKSVSMANCLENRGKMFGITRFMVENSLWPTFASQTKIGRVMEILDKKQYKVGQLPNESWRLFKSPQNYLKQVGK